MKSARTKVPASRLPPGDGNEQAAVSRGHNNCPIIHQQNFDNFNQEKYLRSEFELVIKYNIYTANIDITSCPYYNVKLS